MPLLLTANELKLLKLVCLDKDNNQIAKEMKYTLRYIELIKTSLYHKTKTKSNLGLFKWAVKKGYYNFKR